VSKEYGIFNEDSGNSRRAVVVVDKQGTIRFKCIYSSAADLEVSDILAEVDKL
jgi:alkyl hydroperoxide reductase subunit AhpC